MAQLEQILDVGRDPQAKQRLLSGRTNLVTCPNCGYQAMLGTPLIYHDPAKQLLLLYIPMELNLPAQEQNKLIAARHIRSDEGWLQLADHETGKRVTAHRGSVTWNGYRQRWVMIAVEIGGAASNLGEVWYAEAETPIGPWKSAVKIVTHNKYSFYNPKQHAMLDQNDGRTIYFEGTYTQTFSGNTDSTPRYEYNQIMYRLDLDDPRLKPAYNN